MDYTLKTCPCCGADNLFIEYRRDTDGVQAQYACDCNATDPQFLTKYDAACTIRRKINTYTASLPEQYRHYLDVELDADAGNAKAIRASLNFQRGDILLLWGGTGRGKTHVAAQGALAAIKRGESARFIEEARLMDEMRSAAMNSGDGGGSKFLDKLPTVLLIDDIAKDKATEFYSQAFFRVLECCTSTGRGVILTSNDPIEVIVERLSGTTKADAIESRLRRGQIIEVVGPDRRAK